MERRGADAETGAGKEEREEVKAAGGILQYYKSPRAYASGAFFRDRVKQQSHHVDMDLPVIYRIASLLRANLKFLVRVEIPHLYLLSPGVHDLLFRVLPTAVVENHCGLAAASV